MQKNAIVPYILIMAFGIGLIFFLSLEGANNQEEIAAEHAEEDGAGGEEQGNDGGSTESAEFDPESQAQQSCVSCHGSSYEGAVGPSLVDTELDQAGIEEIIANGKGAMPGGLIEEENIPAMAEWVLSLE
ncbi:cytochrome c550 [Planococcus ruber]|uniref:cytochrome c550 n=1 Tax=Planococcus ruber TaxID=2027871 RepID=UPI001FF03DEB|nr:cytochrome c [Planococcus ruber]MCJ1908787.1 cytochrome c [Planococcus ruber]